ncbi:uncharacterized protein BDR25DRAFT_344245 [Lindgomyces ingoldianus]|uniref:Uncharacterized protein n=1 Tax=Lindgomyces ingoldianus TaxID=673940 RepID=A0ACB6QNG9_9PLEO|nr:uncharacterized protein BDR25DRAFT_344245 [Lindgomyces ingoldianus]KAF2468519.1 hypothetical protein BDR25DRAFT_344245 [Lindgomyces ingoldianus]
MPTEKRKNTRTPTNVPELGDPDRKRVLNVLAQRRYRQKRREKIATLEAQAKGLTTTPLFNQSEDETLRLGSRNASISTSKSEAETTQEDKGAGAVEEILRDPDDVGFPMMDFEQSALDFPLFPDFSVSSIAFADFSTLPSPLPSSPSSVHYPSQASSNPSPPQFNFPLTPDGAQLTIPILSALRAFGTIATMLNVVTEIYNPFHLHTLSPTPPASLPLNLHPTPAQIAIPHHPLLDTLPWPSVREKLICMFALPSAIRPPIARNDDDDDGDGQGKAIMQIMHDVDDFKDGIRVHGNVVGWGEGNELAEEAWEVGETFFRNWWWCLDNKVLEVTNRRRRERGLGVLRLENEKV